METTHEEIRIEYIANQLEKLLAKYEKNEANAAKKFTKKILELMEAIEADPKDAWRITVKEALLQPRIYTGKASLADWGVHLATLEGYRIAAEETEKIIYNYKP